MPDCGAAQGFGAFLAGRAVSGLGAGLIIVAGFVVIGRAYPESLRPKVFSLVSAAWVLPSLLGPPVSAWVTTTWSWRWVFWLVVVPVAAAAAMVLARRGQITVAGAGIEGSSRDRGAHRRAAWLGLLVAAAAMLSRFLLAAAFFGSTTYVPLMLVSERDVGLGTAGLVLAVGSDVLGAVLGIAAAGAVFAAMHTGAGSDTPVYVTMWTGLSAVALLVVVAGRRIRV